MNTPVAPSRLSKSAALPSRRTARPHVDDAEALIAAASDADLELALRLVAWNPRDLGHFLKTHSPR